MRSLILCLFVVGISAFASAQTLVLTDSVPSNDVSKFLHYLPDPNSNLTIGEITNQSINWLTLKDGQTPSLGIQKDAYWFRFDLINNSNRKDWLIHIDYYTLDIVSVYLSDSTKGNHSLGTQGILSRNIKKQQIGRAHV